MQSTWEWSLIWLGSIHSQWSQENTSSGGSSSDCSVPVAIFFACEVVVADPTSYGISGTLENTSPAVATQGSVAADK